MTKDPRWLLEFKRNVYSQSGEDGVLERVLDLLPEKNAWCVEFGAWDGIHLSNVRNLTETRGYAAVLIEADAARFVTLQANVASNPKIIALRRLVGFGADDNLDTILRQTPVPRDFDLLSIDIDGNDYHVWKALSSYAPKVVCVEFNPTIPTEIDFVQPADPSVNQGASLLALTHLAAEKGYELVAVLISNAVFVKAEYFPLFEIDDNAPAALREDLSLVTQMFVGYDGRIFLRGAQRLPWHGLPLKENSMQALPKIVRRYPVSYSLLQRILFRCYRALKH
jgi:hypothetical protein